MCVYAVSGMAIRKYPSGFGTAWRRQEGESNIAKTKSIIFRFFFHVSHILARKGSVFFANVQEKKVKSKK